MTRPASSTWVFGVARYWLGPSPSGMRFHSSSTAGAHVGKNSGSSTKWSPKPRAPITPGGLNSHGRRAKCASSPTHRVDSTRRAGAATRGAVPCIAMPWKIRQSPGSTAHDISSTSPAATSWSTSGTGWYVLSAHALLLPATISSPTHNASKRNCAQPARGQGFGARRSGCA